jgi:hypothetical protein
MTETATQPSSDLERRIQAIEDRLAIQQLISTYGIVLDNRDYDAVGELFTEDARFWQHYGDTTDANTRSGIVEFYRERLGHCGPSYHYHHGLVITLEDDRHATGIVTSHAELGIEGQMIIVGFRYHDRYEKGADDRWRFSERETYFHYFMPAAELPARYCAEIRRTWPGQSLPADIPDQLDSYRREPHAPYTTPSADLST